MKLLKGTYKGKRGSLASRLFSAYYNGMKTSKRGPHERRANKTRQKQNKQNLVISLLLLHETTHSGINATPRRRREDAKEMGRILPNWRNIQQWGAHTLARSSQDPKALDLFPPPRRLCFPSASNPIIVLGGQSQGTW